MCGTIWKWEHCKTIWNCRSQNFLKFSLNLGVGQTLLLFIETNRVTAVLNVRGKFNSKEGIPSYIQWKQNPRKIPFYFPKLFKHKVLKQIIIFVSVILIAKSSATNQISNKTNASCWKSYCTCCTFLTPCHLDQQAAQGLNTEFHKTAAYIYTAPALSFFIHEVFIHQAMKHTCKTSIWLAKF